MQRRKLAFSGFVLLSSLVGCVGDVGDAQDSPDAFEDEHVGQVSATLDSVPGGVGCLRVLAAGNGAPITKLTPVSATDKPLAIDLGYVPVGLFQFSAQAFDGTCPASIP